MIGLLNDSAAAVRRVTWSTINKWRSCKRRWYYRYIGRLSPPAGLALLQGILLHALLDDEAKYNMQIQALGAEAELAEIGLRKKHLSVYISTRMDELKHIFDKYYNDAMEPFVSTDGDMLSHQPPYTEQEVEDSVPLLRGMFENWLHLRGAADLEQYEFVASELFLGDIRIQKPNGKLLRGWRLSGIQDTLLRDKNTKKLILREIKSTKGPAIGFDKRVILDPQVRLYAKAAEDGGFVDEVIDQVQYVALRKALPKLPALINCPKCGGKTHGPKSKKIDIGDCDYCCHTGKVPSLNKKVDSTKDTILAFLVEHGLAGRESSVGWQSIECDNQVWWIDPRYAEYVQLFIGWEKFISLTSHYLSENDKAEAYWEVYSDVLSIRDATRRYNNGESYWICFPRNTNQCDGPAGYCECRELCQMRVSADDFRPPPNWQTELLDNPEIVEFLQERESANAISESE